jgi:hypothetical protein
MAWATVIIGVGLLLMGILGQRFGLYGHRAAHPDEKRAGLFLLRIAGLLIGLWLLIYGFVQVVRMHHHI